MNTLVIAELQEGKLRKSTHSAITFAREVGAPFTLLVLGSGTDAAVAEAAAFGAQKILVADDASLAHPLAETYAPTVAASPSRAVSTWWSSPRAQPNLAPRVAASSAPIARRTSTA